MSIDLEDERKKRKREKDRDRQRKKYEAWKQLPPEQRTPSYYEKNKEARKEYAKKYYQEHRIKCINNQKIYNEQKKRCQHI